MIYWPVPYSDGIKTFGEDWRVTWFFTYHWLSFETPRIRVGIISGSWEDRREGWNEKGVRYRSIEDREPHYGIETESKIDSQNCKNKNWDNGRLVAKISLEDGVKGRDSSFDTETGEMIEEVL